MKKMFLLGIFCFLFADLYAQANDSLAYQLQRNKINSMLDVRAQKFGQYDQSLNEHTGIFGLQTKKDIRRSNDILMDIVKTDNDIYKQLKILLDYRTFQQTQVQDHSKETESSVIAYMNTINKLREQNEKLKKTAEENSSSHEKSSRNFIIIIVLLFASVLLLLRNKYAAKK